MWEHTLSPLVRMDIDRDPASSLLPFPLKLVVLQRDPSIIKSNTRASTPRQTRFGMVHLDLAQYACKGEVTRRYLLKESKTNATLKLTTNVTYFQHASTPTTPMTPSSSFSPVVPQSVSTPLVVPSQLPFTPPPLPPGEILAGIANLPTLGLGIGVGGTEPDVYRERPRGFDLYGPYADQEEMEMDLLGTSYGAGGVTGTGRRRTGSAPGSKKLKKGSQARLRDPGVVRDTASGVSEEVEKPSFDPSRLPVAYGAKTTEMLIDALFNPVETQERRRESPFTVYIPPPHPRARPTTASSGTGAGIEPPQLNSHPPNQTKQSEATGNKEGKERCPPGIGHELGMVGLAMGLGVGLGVGMKPGMGIVPGASGTGDGEEENAAQLGAGGEATAVGMGKTTGWKTLLKRGRPRTPSSQTSQGETRSGAGVIPVKG